MIHADKECGRGAVLRLPAEWERQSFVQLTWPHEATDWAPYIDEARRCFAAIAAAVLRFEDLLVAAVSAREVAGQLSAAGVADGWTVAGECLHGKAPSGHRVTIAECETDDTWARDHAFLTTVDGNGAPTLRDFRFNGWGGKFAAERDNGINARLYGRAIDSASTARADHGDVVLEGGSVESDGCGTILTTASCLLADGRNGYADKGEAEAMLRGTLGAERVLWLDHGFLAGDDTDGHIDTLARLCPDNTIVYVRCDDRADEHFACLGAMERELQALRTAEGQPYRLLPLPMARAMTYEGERLPATYANFLVVNGAVLMPCYADGPNDSRAAEVLAAAFPDREIVGVDCRVLVRQHGSLHCVTMQYPAGVGLIGTE